MDTINPDAAARFIEPTHESYHAYIGEKFGKAVPAIFTDEPQLGKHTQISWAESDEDVSMPTDYLAEKYWKNTEQIPWISHRNISGTFQMGNTASTGTATEIWYVSVL